MLKATVTDRFKRSNVDKALHFAIKDLFYLKPKIKTCKGGGTTNKININYKKKKERKKNLSTLHTPQGGKSSVELRHRLGDGYFL